MELNNTIGARIAQLRRQRGMTQEQLAEHLDISIKHCSSVERGLSSLSLEKLIEVSSLFDVSMDYLIKGCSITKDSFDFIISSLPQSIINTLASDNKTETDLLLEYLHLYTKLRMKE